MYDVSVGHMDYITASVSLKFSHSAAHLSIFILLCTVIVSASVTVLLTTL